MRAEADLSTSFLVAGAYLPTAGQTVRSILAQHGWPSRAEILVAGADLHGMLPAHPAVRVLDEVPPGPACRAYNAMIGAARFEWLVVVDGDCVLEPTWLTTVRAAHARGWDVVSGAVELRSGPYWQEAYNLSLLHEYAADCPAGRRTCLPTLNLSLPKAVARSVGRVREDMCRAYDWEWTLRMTRAGYLLYFEPAARVWHHPCQVTARILWRTWFAGGACSQAVRRAHSDLLRCSRLLDRPGWLIAMAPWLAVWASLRILVAQPRRVERWRLLPALWLSKFAWCLGAAHGRRYGPITASDFSYELPRADAC